MLENECVVSPSAQNISENGNLRTVPSSVVREKVISSENVPGPGSSQVSGLSSSGSSACHNVEECGTPDVKAQYKSKYYACPSSGSIKYIHRTPPSRSKSIVVTNPFDVGITDRLHLPMYSPSVFARVVSPSQDSPTFRWTIEDLSRIYPADIEEFPTQQYEVEVDPEFETKAQEAINRFFCKNQQLLPSPWNPKPDSVNFRQEPMTPSSPHMALTSSNIPSVNPLTDSDSDLDQSGNSSRSSSREVWTQTTLTLPPVLPPSMELALKPFFTFTHDQRQAQQTPDVEDGVLSTSSLRRKLFFQSDSSPLIPSQPPSIHGAPSPSLVHFQGRSFGTPLPGTNTLQSPPGISPVLNGATPMRRVKSATRLDFSQEQEEMAIDTSLTTAPNTPGKASVASGGGASSPLGTAPLHDKDSPKVHSELSQSSGKWVKRNKRNSLDCSSDSMRISHPSTPIKSMDLSCAPNMMDISHCKAPPQADGWRDSSDVTYQHDLTSFSYCHQGATSNILSQDTGYGTRSSFDVGAFQSGTTSMFGLSLTRDKMGYEDSLATWPNNPNLISSTPTKTSG